MFRIEEQFIGGFDLGDPEFEFYLRVRSLLNEHSKVLDLGAGRASWFESEGPQIRKFVRYIKPDVFEVIGADVDPIIFENRSTSNNYVIPEQGLPFDDETFDIIIADYVFEHVEDPKNFAFELKRVLKKGGWICARTPHKLHYVSIFARLIPEGLHTKILKIVKPDRLEQDSFATHYKLNDMKMVEKYFACCRNRSFIIRLRPFYYLNSKFVYSFLSIIHKVLPKIFVSNIFFFLQK